MSYLYAANIDPFDRSSQLEIMLDNGTSAILRLGHFYDLTANELARASQYIVLTPSGAPSDEEPIGIVYLPVKGNPTDGQVVLWEDTEAAFVPADVPGVSGGPFATVASVASKAYQSDLDSVETSVNEETLSAVRVLGSDDTTGMQSRLDDAGGELVQFRDNTYTLTAPLLANHRQRITGNGYQTVIIPAAGQPAIDCRGQGIEIGNLRIKGQVAESRPAAASHGILIDASNNVSSGFYERYDFHNLHIDYLKGYAIKALHGFRESWLAKIVAKACGDTGVPTLHFESFTGDADQINYLKLSRIEVISMHGVGILFKSSQGSSARVGCYGNSIKDSVIHGGDESDVNFLPIANAHGLVFDGASDNQVIDLNVSNIEKAAYCVYVTSNVTGILPSIRNKMLGLILGGVHSLAAAADPTQTGGIGIEAGYADTCEFEATGVGLTKDFEFTANSNRCYYGFRKAGADTTTGTDASTTNLGQPIQRANFALGGKRIVTVGTAGTSPAIQTGVLGSSNQPGWYFSDPTPEGAVSAGVGSFYTRRQGGYSNSVYGKASGTGNTGWAPFAQRAMQTIATDAIFTLTPGTTPEETRHTGTLTANRAVTLSTTGAFAGERFKITRTGGGAFTLDIGTGPLKSLATNQWCEVTYDGSAWYLSAFGSL
jgi:hypothetical protein